VKQKSFFVGLTVTAIVLLIFSIVAVTEVLNANPQDLAVSLEPQAAQFLPKRSPLVAAFLINPDRLTLAAKLATKSSDRRSFNQEITNLKAQLLQTWGLDYERDLQPWLGSEVTLSVTTTDLDRDLKNGLQPGYLIALESSQPTLAQKHLERFWQKQAQAGADLAFEQYQGVSIISADVIGMRGANDFGKRDSENLLENSPRNLPKVSIEAIANAKIGKFVLFANDPSILRNAINNLQAPNLALASSTDYQNSLNHLNQSTRGFALAYINPQEIQGLLGSEKNVNLEADLSKNLPKLPTNLMIGFKSRNLGIEAETILALNPTSDLIPSATPADSEILKYIAEDSSLLVGNNLAQTLDTITKINPQLTQTIAKLAQSLDLPLTLESFNWITDRYAIAIPANSSTKSASKSKSQAKSNNKSNNIEAQAPNWLLITENKHPQQIKSVLAQLDRDARIKSKFTVGEIISGDRALNLPLTLWTKLNPIDTSRNVTGKVALVHTEVGSDSINKSSIKPDLDLDNYIFISNSVSTIETALSSTSILETDSVFKAIATNIGSQNGLIYLNARDLKYFLSQYLLNQNLNQNLSQNLLSSKSPLSLLQRIQSIAIGNTKIVSTPETTFLDGQMILNWRDKS
jgi:hypothetical protein